MNVINVVRLKSFLKWSFLYLTLVLCFFCLFQISLRAFGLYYFSFSNQAESELARYGVSSNNVQLEWRNFNPVLSLENVEHNFFKLENAVVELDFWSSLSGNKVVLKYVSVSGGEVFLYKNSGLKLSSGNLDILALKPYLEMILEAGNLSIDLSVHCSPMRRAVAQAIVSLRSLFHNKRHKVRAELSYPGSGVEPFELMIDQFPSTWWEPNSVFLIQSYGTLALANLIPKTSRASIKVKQGQWRGSLEKGLGVLALSFDGIETSAAGKELSGAATINLEGSSGALGGSIKDWSVSGVNRTLQFEPIWFDYQLNLEDENKFAGFGAWISGQSDQIDIKFFSKFLDLTKISEFVNEVFYDSEIVVSWFSGLNLQGGLSEISGYLDTESGFGLAADLNVFHLDSHKGIPEVGNLSARAYAYSNGVRLKIDAMDAKVRFANVFNEKWHIEELGGELDFWFNKSYFSLANRGISAKFPNFKSVGQFSLSRPTQEHQQSLTLFFETEGINISDRDLYIPNNLPENLITWLDSSIKTGYLEQVSFAYHGLTKPNKYLNSRRVEFKTKYRNLSVKYYEDWPLVLNAGGYLHLKGARTKIGVESARILGVKNFSADLNIDNTNLDLRADIDFLGEGSNFFAFFLNSPLKEELPFLSKNWETDGSIAGDLELIIPLSDFSLNGIELSLDFQLNEFDMVIPDYNLSFGSINGTGEFLLPHHLNGNFRGKLFGQKVSVETESDQDSLDFLFDGIASTNSISRLLDLPLEEITEGTSSYFARMNFSIVEKVNSTFRLTSDLNGFGINLPKPFTKKPLGVGNLEMDIEFLEDGEWFSVSYGDHRAVLFMQNNTISEGAIAFSSKDIPSDISGNQLFLAGSLDRFDVAEYLPYLGNYDSFNISWVLEDLMLENLTYGDFSVNGLTVNANGDTSSSHFELSSSKLIGVVDFSFDKPVVVDLSELDLSIFGFENLVEKSITGPLNRSFVNDLPDVIFNVEHLRLHDEELGSWNFLMRQEENQLELYPLAFEMKGLEVSEGFLRWDLNTNKSYLNAGVLVDDLGKTLTKWGFQPSIVADAVSVDVDFTWDGTPVDFDFLQLAGNANFELTKGRFMEITPAEGGMKLASLLNFSRVLGRIFKFDFSDVRGQGLSFEKVNAKVDFQQGIASFLEPMVVSSTSSRMIVGGSINMIDSTLNNDLIVTLPVSESLPWYAAYLAVANPIAGLGVIVGERVLRKQVEKFSSGKYQIRGAIENPKISFVELWKQEVDLTGPKNSDIID